MTKEQALSVLDQATQQLNANRATHGQIIEALGVLDKALKEPVDGVAA